MTAKVDDADAGLGLKTAVEPEGRPPALRLTAPLKPASGVMVIE